MQVHGHTPALGIGKKYFWTSFGLQAYIHEATAQGILGHREFFPLPYWQNLSSFPGKETSVVKASLDDRVALSLKHRPRNPELFPGYKYLKICRGVLHVIPMGKKSKEVCHTISQWAETLNFARVLQTIRAANVRPRRTDAQRQTPRKTESSATARNSTSSTSDVITTTSWRHQNTDAKTLILWCFCCEKNSAFFVTFLTRLRQFSIGQSENLKICKRSVRFRNRDWLITRETKHDIRTWRNDLVFICLRRA